MQLASWPVERLVCHVCHMHVCLRPESLVEGQVEEVEAGLEAVSWAISPALSFSTPRTAVNKKQYRLV